MSEPFLSEIRMLAFNFAPRGWAHCNGQILPIQQNQALFSLLGTTYGGNGVTTFALPDLRSRVPIHSGTLPGTTLGEAGGEESHMLTASEMPAHTHVPQASSAAATSGTASAGMALATAVDSKPYRSGAGSLVGLDASSVTSAGTSQPHSNMAPFLAVSFAIALQGIFPSRN